MFQMFIALALFVASATAYDVLAQITSGVQPIGLFFYGEKRPEHDVFSETLPEQLLTVIDKNHTIFEGVKFGSSIVLKSADFKTRVLVKFLSAPDEPGNPYRIAFYNLAYGDRGGDLSVELKHSNSGWIWIEPGHYVAHFTAENHPFTIFDIKKHTVFTIKLLPPRKDEL